jgi:single-stranded DNA-binding protein
VGEMVTLVGEVMAAAEWEETGAGKRAWLGICVVTKHRAGDEWVDDPPVVYRVTAADEESLGLAASLGRGTRILVSGVLRPGTEPPVIEAESIMLSVNRHGRG